jgi:uncharacterized protein (DUF362 family)
MNIKVYLEKRKCFTYPSANDYFSPHILYPEYPFPHDTVSTQPNEVYDMIRASLYGLGLDAEHYGNKQWNPLGECVKPGARILIKPNLVSHTNPNGSLDCMVTHPSIIRCLVDYCVIAKAAVIEIGDAPIQSCDFDKLMYIHGYNRIWKFIHNNGIDIGVTDFRMTISKKLLKGMVLLQRENINNDLKKTVEFDLRKTSHFSDLFGSHRYRIANYHDVNLNARHNQEHHKYLITRSVFDADLIINLPKPKTHRFAGLTAAQKNFVGICSEKTYLPHYRVGVSDSGGDESDYLTGVDKMLSLIGSQRSKFIEKQNIGMQIFYKFIGSSINKAKKLFFLKPFTPGQWYGNDTIWRTILDINLILLYGNADGILDVDSGPRHILNIGDMIIAGEKDGPLAPSPKPLGIVLASNNCAVFDYTFCKITGFDYNLIPSIKNAISNPLLLTQSLDDICVKSNLAFLHNAALSQVIFPDEWKFNPHPLWKDIL